jgi:hypothetical protein
MATCGLRRCLKVHRTIEKRLCFVDNPRTESTAHYEIKFAVKYLKDQFGVIPFPGFWGVKEIE